MHSDVCGKLSRGLRVSQPHSQAVSPVVGASKDMSIYIMINLWQCVMVRSHKLWFRAGCGLHGLDQHATAASHLLHAQADSQVAAAGG